MQNHHIPWTWKSTAILWQISTSKYYEGESCENPKSAIKIRNTADNDEIHGLKNGRRVAVQCRNAKRRRSSSVEMVAPLATFTIEEQRLPSFFKY
jgi:hypothetical protein